MPSRSIIVGLGADVARLRKDFGDSRKEVSRFVSSTQSVFKGLGLAIGGYLSFRAISAGLREVSSFVKESIALAGEEELAQKKLATALGFTSQSLLDYASSLQQTTAYGDDAIVGAMALIAAFTKSEAATKKATMATLDLASGAGMDLAGAASLVSKTLGSTTNALQRYGVTVEGAVGSTERLESLTKNISKIFGGQAAAEAETYAGKVKGIKNAWGDMQEEIGRVITDNKFMVDSIGIVKGAIESLGKYIVENKAFFQQWAKDGVLFAADILIGFLKVLDGVAAGYDVVKNSGVAMYVAYRQLTLKWTQADVDNLKEWMANDKERAASREALVKKVEEMRGRMSGVNIGTTVTTNFKAPPKIAGPMTDEALKELQEYAKRYAEVYGMMAQAEIDSSELAAVVRSENMKQGIADTEQAVTDMSAWWGEYAQAIIDSDLQIAESNAEMMKQRQENSAGFLQDRGVIDLYSKAVMDANMAIIDAMNQMYSGMQNWISSSIQGIVDGTLTAKSAVAGLGKMMVSIISDYIATWIVANFTIEALKKAAAAAAIATATVTGAAVAAAWAPAASFVSLASFGGNAPAAMAGMSATYGLAQALAIPKLAEGGIVTRPTLALIGERGPEAVIPLGKGGGNLTVNLMMDREVLYRVIHKGQRTGELNLVLA